MTFINHLPATIPQTFKKSPSLTVGENFELILGNVHYLWVGGAGNNGNRYNSRKSPYLRKIFFTCPFIFPKESKIIDVQNFFAPPLNDAAKNF